MASLTTPLTRRIATSLTGGLIATLLATALDARAAETDKCRVQPRATEELLANPGMGWQTFGRFANEDKNLAGLPSGSAYFRFYWREIEKTEGAIDFAKFDELLARAHKAGQKLAFRIMCTGSGQHMDVPAYLKEQGCKGYEFKSEGSTCWVPEYADPVFEKAHYRLIRELGARYDGHPDMDMLDIGTVGLWGEWHMSGTVDTATGKEVPMPSPEIQKKIIEAWSGAFPRTSKVVLIGSEVGMTLATLSGLGWRADCLGDMGGFSKTWNHMDKYYLQQIARTKADEAWKRAPVAFESCWDMRKWAEAGWDIRYIYDYALRCHASYMNNKSAPLPEGTRDEVERFIRKLGYRLVLESLEHDGSAKRGSRLQVAMSWRNDGVAPPYRDYQVALRVQAASAPGTAKVFQGETVKGWMPGPKATAVEVVLPSDWKPGEYTIAVGIVDPQNREPAVKIPLEKRGTDGWHELSRIRVE